MGREKLLRDYAEEKSWWTGLPNHQPIQPLGYSQCPGQRDNQEPLIPGVSDFVLRTKLGPPPGSHWHFVSLTGSPWLQVHWLGQLPNSLGRTNSIRSGIAQQDGNRHMRWELLQRSSEGSGSVNSQVSLRDNPWPPILAGIQDEIRLKNRLWRQWQITRDPALKAKVNCLQWSVTHWLNKWRNDQWSATLESLNPEDQSLWRMTKRVMRVLNPSPTPVTPGGIALSDSEKAETLADNLEAQFQPVTDSSFPAVIEMVDVALRSYLSPASEPQLTNPDKIHESIRVLKVSKAPGPNDIPNRTLKHLPKLAVSLLTHILNMVLCTHQFPQTWKHAQVISILKLGKDSALPSYYRPISIFGHDW